mmetsp:Transcript_27388/g.42119  ORF Transcript_27388/g.42119 Transcript_27388/m.42119 type:complete len:158 (+) Transcript_27388:256-729(+)
MSPRSRPCAAALLQQIVCVLLVTDAMAFLSYGSMRFSPQPAGGLQRWRTVSCTQMRSAPEGVHTPTKRNGLVVGGAPIGLAMAFALHRMRAIDDVTVIEQADSEESPSAEFPYSLDAETQGIAKSLGLEEHIRSSGEPLGVYSNTIVVDGQDVNETG